MAVSLAKVANLDDLHPVQRLVKHKQLIRQAAQLTRDHILMETCLNIDESTLNENIEKISAGDKATTDSDYGWAIKQTYQTVSRLVWSNNVSLARKLIRNNSVVFA